MYVFILFLNTSKWTNAALTTSPPNEWPIKDSYKSSQFYILFMVSSISIAKLRPITSILVFSTSISLDLELSIRARG